LQVGLLIGLRIGRIASVASALLIALLCGAAAQTPPRDNAAIGAGTGSIRGRVTAVDGETPLTRALIRIVGPGSGPINMQAMPIVATDDEGRYEFNGLVPGSYTLTAAKSGYVTLSYGQIRPGEGGRPVEVGAGQPVTGADFALPRGGLLVAHITDDLGEPITGLYVRTLQRRFRDGESQLVPVGSTVQGAPTNGAGEARFHALLPGDYYVVAGSSTFADAAGAAGNGRVYAPTYYPGTVNPVEAQRVTVGLGQQAGVRFSLVAVRPARVSGTVRTSDGSLLPTASVSLNYRYPGGGRGRNMTARSDGTFSLSNVLPGEYSIDVAPNSQGARAQEFASVPLHVAEADVTGLVLTTGTGGTARGRIVFDTGSPPSDLQPGSLSVFGVTPVRRAGGPLVRPPPRDDWNLVITGLFSPVVFRLNPAPAAALVSGPAAPAVRGWYVKAVMLDGKDITDTPLDFSSSRAVVGLEVIVTKKRTTLTGTTVDSKGVATSEFAAVVFPQNRNEWTPQSSRIAASRPDQQGRFAIVGLPPGEYLAAAVEYLEVGSERDPELLARLADKAARLTLSEGESRSIKLTREE